MVKRGTWGRWCSLGLLAAVAFTPARGYAQGGQLGGQARADAARTMVILGVQQGISSLPPTSGQSLTYEFDPTLSTFVPSESLGPTSFRSTETIGKGKWSLRGSLTYFRLHKDFGPIKYKVEFPNDPTLKDTVGIAEFGLKARANVILMNLGTNYGITDRIEVNFNIPISIVEARAGQVSSTPFGAQDLPAGQAIAGAVFGDATQTTIQELSDEFDRRVEGRKGPASPGYTPGMCPVRTATGAPDPEQCIALRGDGLDDLGFKFNDDASPGVGRISVGAKYLFLAMKRFQMAFSTEFFVPSPNEAEFAGSYSPAILPRLIAQAPVHKYVHLHADAGYDYDFNVAELRRFVWDGGVSIPVGPVTIDFGAGGSLFDKPIEWTPKTATGTGGGFPDTVITALGNSKLGDDFFDFLGGIKVRLAERLILSGAVTTPLNGAGFRAPAVGTIAIEGYY